MPDIDHRIMTPPFLRVAEQRTTPAGNTVFQWDLRLAQPNVSAIAMPVVHSIEHFLGAWLRERSESVVTVAPMGCQTGFYITAIGMGEFEEMAELVAGVLGHVVSATEVPLAHPEHCGWEENHSLVGAQRQHVDIMRWPCALFARDFGDTVISRGADAMPTTESNQRIGTLSLGS